MGDETNSLALAISPFRSTRLGATSGTKSAQLIYAISQPSGGFLAVGSRPCLYLHNGLFRYLGASAISAQPLSRRKRSERPRQDGGYRLTTVSGGPRSSLRNWLHYREAHAAQLPAPSPSSNYTFRASETRNQAEVPLVSGAKTRPPTSCTALGALWEAALQIE